MSICRHELRKFTHGRDGHHRVSVRNKLDCEKAMKGFTIPFKDIKATDVALVGGKNASLGEMIRSLSSTGIMVPDGFATTAMAFRYFLSYNALEKPVANALARLDRTDYHNLGETGAAIRSLFLSAQMPPDLSGEIAQAYRELISGTRKEVAVRSSATAEDLPDASFAGQHESYLHISGEQEVVEAVQRCYASLYTDRAIKYREYHHYAHSQVALSAGIQKMVRSDLSASGIAFTLEPESGFRDIIHISGVWGLGETIVQGTVTPDEFLLFKPTLKKNLDPILEKKKGDKGIMLVYEKDENGVTGTVSKITPTEKQQQFVLTESEIITLGKWCLDIESLYNRPMDIEWAKDGEDNHIYILQARPETVQSKQNTAHMTQYKLVEHSEVLASGQAVGSSIAKGRARLLSDPTQAFKLQEGEIVVTDNTSPDWDPILKKSVAIITNKGGRTSHAAIVARELGVPAIVGCADVTSKLHDGQEITVSCCEGKTGFIYEGLLNWEETTIDLSAIDMPLHTKVMMILGDPEKAFQLSFYPNNGVGLMRMEFIITHSVKIHPMALVNPEKVTDEETRTQISRITAGYENPRDYFIDKLAEGIALIAAAFFPKPVILRMSDFKTNEYAGLIGGKYFEPHEENPMLGFRGASRYYNELYREGFHLECEAVKKVRNKMGLSNLKLMIPFCRTVQEGEKVLEVMAAFGLDRSKDPALDIYMMAEIPSNVLQAADFAKLFDGFSIGSNDLTQLTLGIDRDSSIISSLFNENDPAAKEMIALVIRRGRAAGIPVGLCGQAPSDDPAFARFLVEEGISSISFTPDALLAGIENILIAEQETI